MAIVWNRNTHLCIWCMFGIFICEKYIFHIEKLFASHFSIYADRDYVSWFSRCFVNITARNWDPDKLISIIIFIIILELGAWSMEHGAWEKGQSDNQFKNHGKSSISRVSVCEILPNYWIRMGFRSCSSSISNSYCWYTSTDSNSKSIVFSYEFETFQFAHFKLCVVL